MNPLTVSTVLGALSTLVFPVILQTHWSTRVKSIVVAVICAAAGLEVAYAAGQLHIPHSPADVGLILADIAAVYASSQAVYQGLKKMGILDPIERSTTILPPIHVSVGNPAAPAEPAPDVQPQP